MEGIKSRVRYGGVRLVDECRYVVRRGSWRAAAVIYGVGVVHLAITLVIFRLSWGQPGGGRVMV